MQKKVIIDSGPLVALFNKSDTYFVKAFEFIKKFSGELLSTLAVVTEVFYLLDFSVAAQLSFLKWIQDGGITIVDVQKEDMSRIIELVEKYKDLPVDFADATLVSICERFEIYTIATFDSDFYVYRMKNNKHFTNVFT